MRGIEKLFRCSAPFCLAIILISSNGRAETFGRTSEDRGRVSYMGGGVTNANRNDYSTFHGYGDAYPRNYDYYYYGNRYGNPYNYNYNNSGWNQGPPQDPSQAPPPGGQNPGGPPPQQPGGPPPPTPTPYMTVEQEVESAKAPTIGYVKPYASTDYSRMVIQAMNDEQFIEDKPLFPAGVTSNTTPTPTPAPTSKPKSMEKPADGVAMRTATVVNVFDRGVMVTSSGLRIRLRGVSIPSQGTSITLRKEMATRALAGLRELTVGKKIYFVVENPQKGSDGSLLAIVHLRDGTELNRLALESGMAFFAPGDFPNETDADNLASAEADARKARRGFWYY
ncbi:MAG: thermonuclease family protein [Candidatus Sumerlaeaceae bacterium]|nr:thermonuclease family protein [Candidatus Sumerlaeaceae bacterium]